MRVVIIRHAEVDFCWSKRCTSAKFDSDCREYDLSPIKNVTYSIPQTVYQKVYVSELSRNKDTAKILFPNEEYFESWLINCRRQAEGRRQTRKRAKEFVELIINDDMDIAVVTHGFYMHTLLQEMKKVGFKMTGSFVKFRNGEYVTAEK